jgi:tRNA (guanine-N7-)-methyltransferase
MNTPDMEVQPPVAAAPAASPTVVIQPPDIASALPFHEIFDPTRPLEVDVGCGKGRFLLARATAHRDVQFLGIDRQLDRIRKIDRKVIRAGLDNVRLLRLEALYSLNFLLPAHSIRTVYVFFPDPWPKRRHHRHRIFSPAFLDVLWSRLVSGGRIEAATDNLEYFQEIRKILSADARFHEVPAMERNEAEQTDFERIFRGQGLPIGACAFETRPAQNPASGIRLQTANEGA